MKSKLNLGAACALLVLALASVATAQTTLVTYNTDLAAPNIGAVSSSATFVNASSFTLNNVTLGRVVVAGSDHAAVINPTVAQTTVNLATTLSNATYFSITLQPTSGYALNLASLSFEANAGGTSSPRGFAVFSSIGGFSAGSVLSQDNNGTGGTLTARPTQTTYSVALSSLAGYQNVTDSIEFRFYVQGATAQSIDFDNITINGSVSAIPEPSSYALLAGSTFLMVALWSRRRRA